MGLLFGEASKGDFQLKAEADLLHRMGCKACPLASEPGRMEPTGAAHPKIYIIGEAPGKDEIEQGKQFVGVSGQLLREYISEKWLTKIRWNNTVRSRPPRNRTPERPEIEACRPSIVADIEQSKPEAIFGFGNVPLHWASGFSGITFWRGRRMPVRVGNHVCWYYAFLHPSFLLRDRRKDRYSGDPIISEDERMMGFDLEQAFFEVEQGLSKPVVHSPEMAKSNVTLVKDIRGIEKALQWAARQPEVGLDYETNRLRPYEAGAKLLTAAVGTLEQAFAFPVMHPGAEFSEQQVKDVLELFQRFLLHAPCRKLVHNLAFEMEWSGYLFGGEVLRARPWEDSANAAAILDERVGKQKPGCFSLEFLVQQYFGFNLKEISNVDRKRLEQTLLDTVLLYNGMDAKYHHGLWTKLWGELQNQGLEYPYQLAVRRVPTVVLSQLRGIPIDQSTVQVLSKKYGKKIDTLEHDIGALPVIKQFASVRGKNFNPYSPQDVLYVLEHMLHREEIFVVDKYTKKEKRSTEDSILAKIDHPLAEMLRDLREATGTKSKYIDSLDARLSDSDVFPDGLSHGILNTFFSEPGRLSAEDPNWQNFPKRDAETREVRSSVRAPSGCLIFSFDYGQIEARILAIASKDLHFIKALLENYDIHMEWAERIAYDYPQRVGGRKMLSDKKAMKAFRTDVKNEWTFPAFYGAKLESIAGYLKIPVSVVKPHFNAFWKQFEGVKAWQGDLVSFYNKYGFVECLTKRRRRGPLSLNQVLNSPIQGTAAEVVLDAMSRLSETGDPELQPELQIHDDLTWFRVPEKHLDLIAEKIVGMMVQLPFEWAKVVPFTVEMSVGKNWEEMQEVGTFSSATWGK